LDCALLSTEPRSSAGHWLTSAQAASGCEVVDLESVMRGAQLICPENARLSSSILAVTLPRLKQQEALAPSLRLGGEVRGQIPQFNPEANSAALWEKIQCLQLMSEMQS
tara:strand:- start:140 stop:466 length:327 start_codon:yes stop_codon:yes gene_type:complete